MKEYITLTVDGKSVRIEKGSTLLEAARKAGADIPTLCHDERVKPYGACGMCVVECKGSPKLMRSCAIEAADGMEIITESDRINRARRFSLEMLLSDHTGDCKAPCSLACPAGTDCQGYVGLIANGENAQALSVIKGKIPLPASIGRVCPHPCEKKCRRGLVEEPISIAALKAYAADRDLESGNIFMPEVAESTGKKVAIIGGGPGGISAAYYLAIKGHDVTVFDMMPKMGGMLRYGIPQYRLPKEVLDKELALVEKLGVEFRNNIKIGRDISLDTLNQEYDAVIAAPGAWSSTKMRVDGEDAEGVFGGIDFLRSVILGSPVDIGKRVAVCGGGNTAMDACRTAVRLGAEKVYIIYRRTRDEMPADALEIDEAQEEGVDFRFLTNPDKILTQDGKVCGIKLQIMELGEPDASGRRKPVPIEGKFETLEVDSVIMAIGQEPELGGFEELDKTSRGTISADESTFRTNINGIFAIGDATNKGADIAISAIGEAQKSVAVVDSYLRGNIIGYKKPILVKREINKSDLADREHIARERMRPILTLGNAVFAAMQKVDLIEIFPVAQLHDFGFEVFHRRVCAAVFAPGAGVCRSVHVRQERNFLYPQRIDNDMHMDIAAVVVSVRVGADNGLVSGKLLPAKFLAQRLRPVYGQTVVHRVPWVKADNVVVAFYIFPLLVLPIAEIGAHTGNGKILVAAVQRGYSIVLSEHEPPVFIKGGLHGKLVMFKGEVLLGCAIVRIFRADMFECCQQRHLPFAGLQTSRQQGQKWRRGLQRTGRCMVCRTR